MEYVAPSTLAQAFDALSLDDARCLAGGQSLVAMMNLGLANPARLVSLRRIPELRGVTRGSDGTLRIGAMTTHSEIAALDPATPCVALLAQTAALVAYPAVRAWGTIGGSIAHADPAADYPVALVAANATIEIRSSGDRRSVAATQFFKGLFETDLRKGEIVTAIHVPPGPADARAAYEKLSLVAGDFAVLSVAALVGAVARIAIGGFAVSPRLVADVSPTDAAVRAAGRELAAATDALDDLRASAGYRRRALPELMWRCVKRAIG